MSLGDPMADFELVDAAAGVVLRRVTVGPLATNCLAVHPVGSTEAIVVDPGDEPARLLDAFADLRVTAIVLTHTHWDHVLAVPDLADATGAPVLVHPADAPVWPHELHRLDETGHWDAGTATDELLSCGCALHPATDDRVWDGRVDRLVEHGEQLRLGDVALEVVHTPGHTPGGVCLRIGGHVLTGDTLFPGGPGLTGWPLSDFATIIDSIATQLFTLPGDTVVHPGHGFDTTIGTERPHLADWIARGW